MVRDIQPSPFGDKPIGEEVAQHNTAPSIPEIKLPQSSTQPVEPQQAQVSPSASPAISFSLQDVSQQSTQPPVVSPQVTPANGTSPTAPIGFSLQDVEEGSQPSVTTPANTQPASPISFNLQDAPEAPTAQTIPVDTTAIPHSFKLEDATTAPTPEKATTAEVPGIPPIRDPFAQDMSPDWSITDQMLRQPLIALKDIAVGGAQTIDFLKTMTGGDILNAAVGNQPFSLAEKTREAIDKATGGLTAPYNKAEAISQTAGEFIAGFGTGGAALKAANLTEKVAEGAAKSYVAGVSKMFTPASSAELTGAAGLGAGIEAVEQNKSKVESPAIQQLNAKLTNTTGIPVDVVKIGAGVATMLMGTALGKPAAFAVERAAQYGDTAVNATKLRLGTKDLPKASEALDMSTDELSQAMALDSGAFADDIKKELVGKEQPVTVVPKEAGKDTEVPTEGEVTPPVATLSSEDTAKQAELHLQAADAIGRVLDNSSFYTQHVNQFGKLMNIERERAAILDLDVGSKDILERSAITPVINRAAQGRTTSLSWLGDTKANSILVHDVDGNIIRDTTTFPLRRIYNDAYQGGGSYEDLGGFLRAKDTMDMYANRDFELARVKNQIDDWVTTKGTTENPDTSELTSLLAKRKEIEKQTFATSREETQAVIDKYAELPWAQQALERNNKLNNVMLDQMVMADIISPVEASRMRAAHPNYLPAFKEVEDLTGGSQTARLPGASRGVRARTGSDLETIGSIEAQVRNISRVSAAIEKNAMNVKLLDYFKELSPEEFSQVFRENLDDVTKAYDSLKADTAIGFKADEVTPIESNGKIIKTGNIKLYVNGHPLELTVKNPDIQQLFEVADRSTTPLLMKFIRAAGVFTRNAITVYDPTFAVRSLEREAGDAAAFASPKNRGFLSSLLHGEKPKTVPVVSNVKMLFGKELEPELYSQLKDNFGRTAYHRLEGKTTDQLIDYIKGDETRKPGLLGKALEVTSDVAHNFTDRVDMSPRYLNYKSMIANGETPAAALRTSYEVGFNPMQQGSLAKENSAAGTFYRLSRAIPFASAFVNSTDRLIQRATKEPGALAAGFVMGPYLFNKMIDINNQQYTNPETGKPFVDEVNPDLMRFKMPIFHPGSKSANDYIPLSQGWVLGRAFKPVDITAQKAGEILGDTTFALFRGLYKLYDKKTAEMYDERAAAIEKQTGVPSVSYQDITRAWSNYFTDLAALPTTIPIVSTYNQLVTNKDVFGRPIVVQEAAVPELNYTEFNDRTSPLIRDMARHLHDSGALEVSPQQAEYAFNNLLFSQGQVALRLADTIYTHLGTAPEEPQDRNFPGATQFIGNMNERVNSGISTDYGRLAKEINNVQKGYEDLKGKVKGGLLPVEDLIDYQQKNLDTLALYKQVAAINKISSKIRNEVSRITLDSNFGTPERELQGDPEKRKAIDDLYTQMESMQKDLLDRVKESNQPELYAKRKDQSFIEKGLNKAATQLKSMYNKSIPGTIINGVSDIVNAGDKK